MTWSLERLAGLHQFNDSFHNLCARVTKFFHPCLSVSGQLPLLISFPTRYSVFKLSFFFSFSRLFCLTAGYCTNTQSNINFFHKQIQCRLFEQAVSNSSRNVIFTVLQIASKAIFKLQAAKVSYFISFGRPFLILISFYCPLDPWKIKHCCYRAHCMRISLLTGECKLHTRFVLEDLSKVVRRKTLREFDWFVEWCVIPFLSSKLLFVLWSAAPFPL